MTAIQGETQTAVQDDTTTNGSTRPKKTVTRSRALGRTASGSARATARPRSEPELLAEISTKLDRVVAVLAAQGKDRDTQVAILAAANCDSAFIGTLLGMSPGAVRKLPGWRRAQGDGAADGAEEPAR